MRDDQAANPENGMTCQMDSEDRDFRSQIATSIHLFASNSRFFNPQKWIELILTRLESHPIEPPENERIHAKIAAIRRFMDADEVGSAKHELLSLSAELMGKQNDDVTG